ncbi:hypothetical protein [Thermoactinomyces sp. DSM 45892]|uniref:hypothetical protein n=1 Tax=Thermoactinomyces sp. DSM 45892 TaxID=1882753 RepID=UPI00089A87BC|nr:hypothetical protein [Thermoactinomyces sp. DSM 45892]SDY80086.1 hypothetical protein SAMN05444416_108128 [Thermoactinomyces sp. DSM 45892]
MVKVNVKPKREKSAVGDSRDDHLVKVVTHPSSTVPTSVIVDPIQNQQEEECSETIETELIEPVEPKPPAQGRTFLDALSAYRFRKVFSIEDDRESEIIEWSSPHTPPRNPKKRRFNWKKTWLQIVLSIVGATVLGSIMGVSVLSLFFSEEKRSTNSIDSHLTPKSDSKQETPVQGDPNHFPELPFILMETGGYGDASAAQKGVFELRAKGFASVLSFANPDRIFVGMTIDEKQAGQLSNFLKQKGIPVSSKKVQSSQKETKKQIDSSLQSFIHLGNEMVQEMTPLTVAQLTSSKEPPPFPFKAEYLEKHRKLLTDGQAIATSLPQTSKNYLSEMIRGIDQSVQAAEEAQKNPNTALLWMIQEGLVRYSTSYQQLIESFQ